MDGDDDSDLRLSIGQLARRAGLSVKTIRWYTDQGIVPPAGRTAADTASKASRRWPHLSEAPAFPPSSG